MVKKMPRPIPTTLVHFTHVDHLATVIDHGLVADTVARTNGLIEVEVGHQGIKEQRRRRAVPIGPGGVVADYVPFYFAPRSPMMFAIDRGTVPTYQDGCDSLIYLVSSVERLVELGTSAVFTDRNAALALATFDDDPTGLDTAIDWDLMAATYWNNTQQDPDRRERRMAEYLVHEKVPWEAFLGVVARTADCANAARATLASLSPTTQVAVRPTWYF